MKLRRRNYSVRENSWYKEKSDLLRDEISRLVVRDVTKPKVPVDYDILVRELLKDPKIASRTKVRV